MAITINRHYGSIPEPCGYQTPGVNRRESKRRMRRLYKKGMSISDLAHLAYEELITDSKQSAYELAVEIFRER